MPDANSYAINLELSLDDKITSKLGRVKDSLSSVDKESKKFLKDLNKELYTIHEIRRTGIKHFEDHIAKYAKSDIHKNELQSLIEKAKLQEVSEKSVKSETNDEVERGKTIESYLKKEQELRDIKKEQYKALGGIVGAIGGKLISIVGLSVEWSKAAGTTTKAYGLLDELFLSGIKKKNDAQKKWIYKDKDGNIKEYAYKTRKEKYFIKKVLEGRHRLVKDLEKIGKKGNVTGKVSGPPIAGGGGKAGGGGGGELSGGGGFGAAGAIGRGAATAGIAAFAIGLGAVIGAIALLSKSLMLAGTQFEHFHTINFNASGGAQVLSESVFRLGMVGTNTTEEIQKAASAISSLGYVAITASGDINKNFLSMTNLVANYTRATGIAEEQVASFMSMQRGLGTTFTGPRGTLSGLYRITTAMKKYGLTTQEASSILKSAQDITYKLAVTFNKGGQAANMAVSAYSRVGAAAKQLGLDVAESANLMNSMADNMLNFIVVTGGASLKGPIEGMAAIIEKIDDIKGALPEDPLVRDILLKNVYKISEKDLKMAEKLKQNFASWKQDLLAGEKSATKRQEYELLGAKEFLLSMEKSTEAASDIERMAKQSNNNIERQWSLLKSMVLSILGKVATDLMPTFVNIGKLLIGAVSSLAEFVTGVGLDGMEGFFDVLENAGDSASEFAKAIDKSAQASYDQLALDESFEKLQQTYESKEQIIDEAFIDSMKASIQNKETLEKLELAKDKKLGDVLYGTLVEEIRQRQASIEASGDLDFEKWQDGQQNDNAFADAAKGLQVRESKGATQMEAMIKAFYEVGRAIVSGIYQLVWHFDEDAAGTLLPAVTSLAQSAKAFDKKVEKRIEDQAARIEAQAAKAKAKAETKEAEAQRERNDKLSEKASNTAVKDKEAKSEVVVMGNEDIIKMMAANYKLSEEQTEYLRKISAADAKLPVFARNPMWANHNQSPSG